MTRPFPTRRMAAWAAAVTAATAAAVLTGGVVASPAAAVACNNAAVRFSATSNRIYVESGTQTLSSITAQCPGVPLKPDPTNPDPAKKTWLLSADLQVENGATLSLHGTAAGGDVDVLRLKSAATNLATDVATLTAMYGTLDLDHTALTSWDPAANGPDTNTALPANAGPTDRARAYVKALSYLDPDGTAHESRMTISASDLGYLGYYASEAYGVVFKARGCDVNNKAVCDALNVGGFEKNSRFHDNYFGTYTWDAYDMDFTNNEYDHNVGYGLDPHDDSDNLRIVGNSSHDNGNHGIICSQRCDHLTITDNESYRNGLVPWVGPHDIDASDNQVHGIMIHRGVTDSVIAHNFVHDNPNGAGIAVFESFGDTIEANTITNNKYGLRFSVGSHDIVARNNTLTGTTGYGFYAYRGKDAPVYTQTGGRNVDLTFANNTVNGTAGDTASISETDRVAFTGNTVTGVPGKIRLDRSSATTLVDNTLPSSVSFAMTSAAGAPNDAVVRSSAAGPRPSFKATVDAGSALSVVTDDGRLSAVSAGTPTAISASAATLKLPVSTSSLTVTAAPMAATAAGGATARPGTITTTSKTLMVTAGAAGQQVAWSMGGFTPGTTYVVRTNNAKTGTATADASGTVTGTLTAPGTTEVPIKVSTT